MLDNICLITKCLKITYFTMFIFKIINNTCAIGIYINDKIHYKKTYFVSIF